MVNEPINRMRNVVEKNPGSNDPFEAELEKDRERQLNTLIGLSDKFGDSLSKAFAKNIAEGKKFDNVLKSLRQSLVETGLRLALAPLQLALSQSVKSMTAGSMGGSLPLDGGGLLGGLFKGVGSLFGSLFGPSASAHEAVAASPFARGGVFSRGMVMPFAKGGVVGAPAYFPLGRGLGLMGERGAEAVMPLARGPDGRLGVQAGAAARPASITVNISTPDAESFRRSEAQVSAALARAVARGQRGM
jgi:phage-related minor tail protein